MDFFLYPVLLSFNDSSNYKPLHSPGLVLFYSLPFRNLCYNLTCKDLPQFLQRSFQDLLLKQDGDRAMWEYPFAVAGVNITFMLIQMLDLEAGFLVFSFSRLFSSVYFL